MRIIIGTSVFLAASLILVVVVHLGDVKDSKASGTGAYRAVSSGNWEDAGTWEIFDGENWLPADNAPGNEVRSVTVTSGSHLVLADEIELNDLKIEKNGKLSIESNYIKLVKRGDKGGLVCDGELQMGDAIIEGNADCRIGPGAVLYIGSDMGIDKKAATGNIQLKGKKEFHKDAVYVFNGTIKQHSGNGLPAVLTKLIIDNSSGVELDQSFTVTGVLELKKGILSTDKSQLTLGTSSALTAEVVTDAGSICGRIKYWYGPSNFADLVFPISDGTGKKNLKLVTDVDAYKKGLAEVIFQSGVPDDSRKSPYEARHVVAAIFSQGFYSVYLTNGPDEAWLKLVSSEIENNSIESITWYMSGRETKNTGSRSIGKTGSNTLNHQNFSNLFTGPTPFNEMLVVRFHSETAGVAHLALVSSAGKVVHSEKIQTNSGYNQVIIHPAKEISDGDFMVQLSDIAEIKTIKAVKSSRPV